MVPIVINKDNRFDEESFRKFLANIYKQHKSEGRALVFAFIVYDFDNHTITDIIKKKSYWNALDKISGKTLSIFYINSQDSYYKTRQEEIYQEELREKSINSQSGVRSFMVPIIRKPTPTDNAIGYFKSEFELDDNIKTPFVMFFQIDNNDDISDSIIVGLKQDRLEEAFLELKNHIKNAVESLDKVLPENHTNHQEIFDLLKRGVASGSFYDFVNNKVKPKIRANIIITLVRLISGGK
jgi:hypothetical protein